MALQYLDFDYSEDAEGTGTWDAMASVPPERLGALLAEVSALLAWAHSQPGLHCAPLEDGGDWQFDLQSLAEEGAPPLQLHYDPQVAQVRLTPAPPEGMRHTLTLTLSGNPAFAAALRARWSW